MRILNSSFRDAARPRIVVFFVTADPLHYGHLMTLLRAAQICGAFIAVLVPVSLPPYKFWRPDIGIEHKSNMCKLLIDNQTMFDGSIELLIGDPLISLTINPLEYFARFFQTISRIAETYADHSIVVTGGMDFYRKLCNAMRYVGYLHAFNLASEAYKHMTNFNQFSFLPQERSCIDGVEVSSTIVRELIANGLMDELLKFMPQEVLGYIETHKLYGSGLYRSEATFTTGRELGMRRKLG